MPLGADACPLPGWLQPLIEAYISSDAVALAVDIVVAVAVLVVAEALLVPVLRRAPWLIPRLWLLRGALAAGLVLVHEYVKEGYFFKLSDLGWPPRSHESFTVLVALLSTLVRAPLVARGVVGP